MARTLFFIGAFAKAQMPINGLGARNVLGRSAFLRNGPVRVRLFSFLREFLLVAIRMHRGNFERLIAQNQAFHKRAAATHDGPIQPFVLRLATGQIMLFNIDIARRLTHSSSPIEPAAHHDALDKRLATHVRFVRTVFSKRALHGAALAGGLTAFVFRGHAEHFLVGFIFFRHAFSFVRHAWSFLLDSWHGRAATPLARPNRPNRLPHRRA